MLLSSDNADWSSAVPVCIFNCWPGLFLTLILDSAPGSAYDLDPAYSSVAHCTPAADLCYPYWPRSCLWFGSTLLPSAWPGCHLHQLSQWVHATGLFWELWEATLLELAVQMEFLPNSGWSALQNLCYRPDVLPVRPSNSTGTCVSPAPWYCFALSGA